MRLYWGPRNPVWDSPTAAEVVHERSSLPAEEGIPSRIPDELVSTMVAGTERGRAARAANPEARREHREADIR